MAGADDEQFPLYLRYGCFIQTIHYYLINYSFEEIPTKENTSIKKEVWR